VAINLDVAHQIKDLVTSVTFTRPSLLRTQTSASSASSTLRLRPITLIIMGAAQRKRATMLYFANVFLFIYLLIFYGRLILRPWLTEVRENFTRGRP